LSRRITRRALLGQAARGAAAASGVRWLGAGLAIPAIVPGRALGAQEVAPASERVRLALIGCGDLGRGGHHLGRYLGLRDVEVVAVCDVDASHRADAKKQVDTRYQNSRCGEYLDYRDVLERRDVDAVAIVTPDHWHALIAVAAAEAGKDIYCEKPLSLTIEEGRAMVNAARRYARVFQTGSQQRSDARFRTACQAVRNGRIGRLQSIEARIGGGPISEWQEPGDPPPGLDWNFWLGPARWVPYQKDRCHYNFRWIYDYSGGKLTDWGAHHNDIAQWGLGTDESGPTTVQGTASFPTKGIWDTPTSFEVTSTYPNGVVLRTKSEGENGILFTGQRGWIFVSRGVLRASDDASILDPFSPSDVQLYESADHHGNWFRCIKTRERPICDVEIGHRSATVCHLGNIAIRTGRKLVWDPRAERITNDSEANRWLGRPMRAPWHL
jgi:predicted dehydrogenase